MKSLNEVSKKFMENEERFSLNIEKILLKIFGRLWENFKETQSNLKTEIWEKFWKILGKFSRNCEQVRSKVW